jgi:hypothetical protein
MHENNANGCRGIQIRRYSQCREGRMSNVSFCAFCVGGCRARGKRQDLTYPVDYLETPIKEKF